MFALAYLNYSVLHSTRSVWSAATHDFLTIYEFTKDEIANMNACFLGAYAVSGLLLS